MEKIDARSLSAKAQERLRQLAVNAVLEGKKQVEVAKLYGVTRRAVSKWLKAYRNGGLPALKAKAKGRPQGGSLKPWQAAQIAKTVIDHHPEQLKLPFYLWTREAVAKLIQRKFGIKVSPSTSGRYLKRWGFTPQKPVRRAVEQNPQEVRNWLEKEYPAIRQQAKSEKAQIFWGDEMGLRSDHAVGRSYGLRGQTPVIVATGKRFGCNMISAHYEPGPVKLHGLQRPVHRQGFPGISLPFGTPKQAQGISHCGPPSGASVQKSETMAGRATR